MPVSTAGHRFGQDDTGGVDSLEDPGAVHSSGDLSDEDWGHSLGSQFLVHTQEINLNHFLFPANKMNILKQNIT